MKDPKPFRRRGFTLVELLVVIVIIATLSTLAFVGVGRAKASAYMTQSMTRIRALQQANINYANDNNGRYVPGEGIDETTGTNNAPWFQNGEFLEYLLADGAFAPGGGAVVTEMPEVVLDPVVVRRKPTGWQQIAASYGMMTENISTPAGSPNLNQRRASNLKHPAQTAAFLTATDGEVTYAGRLIWEGDDSEGLSDNGKIAYRHRDKAVVVFFDGHTESVSPGDIKRIDGQGGLNHPFWGGER